MKRDEIRDILKEVEPHITTIEEFWNSSRREEEYRELFAKSEQIDFWQHPERISISQRLQLLKTDRERIQNSISSYKDLSELTTLFADDEATMDTVYHEALALRKEVERLKLSLLLSDPQDNANCFITINAGAGGTESQDWAEMLMRMYLRFCEREEMRTELLDYQPGESAGIKSATIFVKGKYSYGLLKGEQGVHRLVRISPYDANKRRHTSFAAILVLPETPTTDIVINPDELRIDTYRAGGAGGQHVNKTESAVRITHIPTNTVVQCQNERSQRQNKETALKMLAAKLKQIEKEREQAKHAAIERKKIEWGSQIRSYVLHPYKLAKDHRTDQESAQPDLVLDGDLMPFIEAFLVSEQKLNG